MPRIQTQKTFDKQFHYVQPVDLVPGDYVVNLGKVLETNSLPSPYLEVIVERMSKKLVYVFEKGELVCLKVTL